MEVHLDMPWTAMRTFTQMATAQQTGTLMRVQSRQEHPRALSSFLQLLCQLARSRSRLHA